MSFNTSLKVAPFGRWTRRWRKNAQSAAESRTETSIDATFKRLREHMAAMRWTAFDEELAALEKTTPGLQLPPDIKDAKDDKSRRK